MLPIDVHPSDIERIRAADRRLVEAARDLKVLSALSWPSRLREEFLAAWRSGRTALPEPPAVKPVEAERIDELDALSIPVSDDPLARFVAESAASYRDVARMLGVAGTPAFTDLSAAVYGRPTDPVAAGEMTSLEAARRMVASTMALTRRVSAGNGDDTNSERLAAEQVRDELDRAFTSFFGPDVVEVKLDPDLAAKAAAGARFVRVRRDAEFTRNDVDQLVQHEGFVHSATLINGRRQPLLTSLGLGAPRTTAVQEGLATFAELVTGTIDLDRLTRLALRIVAIQMALDGADFIDVFRFFLDHGQTEEESFQSAARVFRGGDVQGRVAFTKDAVYLPGLIGTYAFFHTALAALKVEYPRWMFAGRLTWGDVVALEPFFHDGTIEPAVHVPGWAANREKLAAFLAFSNLAHLLPLPDAQLHHFADAPTTG
jgi:uncharacterized protein (TIGR02421 family)